MTAEENLLTHERDDAIEALTDAIEIAWMLRLGDDTSVKETGLHFNAFLSRTYKKFPFLCQCHKGSVCGDACQTSHHGGCGYDQRSN